MKKRFISLFLCLLLTLTTCALGEEPSGRYAFREDRVQYNTSLFDATLRGNEGAQSYRRLFEALLKNLYIEFDETRSVFAGVDFRNINELNGTLNVPVFGEASDAKYTWSADGDKLIIHVLIPTEDSESASSDLSAIFGTFLPNDEMVMINDLRFSRISGEGGYAGVWQMDMEELIAQLNGSQADLPLDVLALFDLYLLLNEDGTIGVNLKTQMGTYENGFIRVDERLLALNSGIADTLVCFCEGDKLILSATTVEDGAIRSFVEIFYKVK